MTKKIEIEYVEGIPCEVKNPAKKSVVKFYQQNLRPEIDKYIGNNTMTDSKKAYANALEVNLIIAPFVLGWLKKPGDDEYRVITGRITIEELNKKNGPTNVKKSTAKKTRATPKSKDLTATPSKPEISDKVIKNGSKSQKIEKPETKKATQRAAPKKNKKD